MEVVGQTDSAAVVEDQTGSAAVVEDQTGSVAEEEEEWMNLNLQLCKYLLDPTRCSCT